MDDVGISDDYRFFMPVVVLLGHLVVTIAVVVGTADQDYASVAAVGAVWIFSLVLGWRTIGADNGLSFKLMLVFFLTFISLFSFIGVHSFYSYAECQKQDRNAACKNQPPTPLPHDNPRRPSMGR